MLSRPVQRFVSTVTKRAVTCHTRPLSTLKTIPCTSTKLPTFQSLTTRNSPVFLAAGAAVCPVNHSIPTSIKKYKYETQPDDNYFNLVKQNEDKIRKHIESLLEDDEYDGYGNYGPVFIRLAWHSSGTFDVETKTGGSSGGCIRFRGTEQDEGRHGANNGLDLAVQRLAPVKAAFPWLSYADLFTFAGVVAAEKLSEGKVKVPFHFGRFDYAEGDHYVVDRVRLPDASRDQTHVRDVFTKQMGFNDQEIVALLGAHAVGLVHPSRSGFGIDNEPTPWTTQPLTLGTHYYTTLLNEKWTPVKNPQGNIQFENENHNLVMLPAEYVLIVDPKFRQFVEMYAKDEKKWSEDFSEAFGKLLALGTDPKSQ